MTEAPAAHPRVSLVVVNYNGAPCIRGCVESLLTDDPPAREVIVVDNASTDSSAVELAASINQKRAVHYGEIAAKNGTDPTAVAALAGRKLIERAPPGQWVRDSDGNWKKIK